METPPTLGRIDWCIAPEAFCYRIAVAGGVDFSFGKCFWSGLCRVYVAWSIAVQSDVLVSAEHQIEIAILFMNSRPISAGAFSAITATPSLVVRSRPTITPSCE